MDYKSDICFLNEHRSWQSVSTIWYEEIKGASLTVLQPLPLLYQYVRFGTGCFPTSCLYLRYVHYCGLLIYTIVSLVALLRVFMDRVCWLGVVWESKGTCSRTCWSVFFHVLNKWMW